MTNQPVNTPREAPNSQDAENATLGSLISNPYYFADVRVFIKAEDFFILRNAWIWESMENLYQRGESIEYLTVIEELRAQGRLEHCGGYQHITYLTSTYMDAMQTVSYARVVERLAYRRRLLEVSKELEDLAYADSKDWKEIDAEAHSLLDDMRKPGITDDLVTMAEVTSEEMDAIERVLNGEDQPTVGVPSGFTDLDHILGGGFQQQNFIIIAGRPGWGKTAFMLNTSVNMAKLDYHVAFFSLEMDQVELNRRVMAMETGITSQKIRRRDLNDQEWETYVEAAKRAREAHQHIHVSKVPEINLSYMRSKCKHLKRVGKLDAIMLDYIGLMQAEKDKDNRRIELEVISRGFKLLARELNVPLISGAQMNRGIENRGEDSEPRLADLRETGAQEQDTDLVMFIYPSSEEAGKDSRTIKIAKHRNGATGSFVLHWTPQLTLLKNAVQDVIEVDTGKVTRKSGMVSK
jgi:replicative DNA helicase